MMSDYQNVDAECIKCGGMTFRIWWVIDLDNPAGPKKLRVNCRVCKTTSELREPEPDMIQDYGTQEGTS
jgi:hypothetical protein